MPTINKQVAKLPPARVATGVPQSLLDRIGPVKKTNIDRLKVSVYGCPKCLGRGTPVLMYDGTIRAVEDVVVGDQVMGPDSRPRNVNEVSEHYGTLYRIIPIKGDSWVCNDDHLLTLTGTCQLKGQVRDVSVANYLAEVYDKIPYSQYWRLFRATGTLFEKSETPLPFPPYLVGLWMGDGKRGQSEIANRREIIQDYCRKAAGELGMKCKITPMKKVTGHDSAAIYFSAPDEAEGKWQGRPGRNALRTFFRERCGTSGGVLKQIPQEYLTASMQERRELLAGILDTDGRDTKVSHTSVTVTGEPYRDGLLFLCRSLGLAAYCTETHTYTCVNGKLSTYFGISISGDLDKVPTLVKKFSPRRQEKRVNVVGFEVEDAGEGEFFGFTLDGDGRFLLGDFTVTHNSGKTRFACTFPKPLLIAGAEDGTDSVVGVEGVDFIRLERSSELAELVSGPLTTGHYRTVVLDTATKLRDMRIVELFDSRGMAVPDRKPFLYADKVWKEVWIQCSKDMKDLLRPLLDLPRTVPICVVVIAQEQNLVSEEGTGPSSDMIRPAIGSAVGKSVSDYINAECSYICQAMIRAVTEERQLNVAGKPVTQRVKTGKMEYCLRVGPHEVYYTGFRMPLGREELLPDFIVDPSYDKIVELLQG